MPTFAAVDLGATSGRVVNVHIEDDTIDLDVVRRFPTTTVAGPDGALAWDFDALLAEVRLGLIDAAQRARLESVAVDTPGASTTGCSTRPAGGAAGFTPTVRRGPTV